MADLTGSTIASSYDQLLALPSGGGDGSTLVALTDGNAGNTFALQVSTAGIKSTGTLNVAGITTMSGDLRLEDDAGGEYFGIGTPATVTTYTLTVPAAVGGSGQALRTSDGSGTLEWYTPETGDITGVTAGTGLSGGGTSGTVTLNVEASQTQITALGTIGTGVWQGTAVDGTYIDLEGTEVKSTGETGGTKFLREDGDGTCSWQAGGSGTVTSITAAADSGSGTAITSSGTLTFTGGTNVTTSVSGTTVTVNSTDQYSGTVTSVGGTGTVNGLTLTGTVTGSGNLTLGGTLPVEIGIACSDETTALTTGDNKARLMIPEAMTLTEVKASLSGADTGGVGVEIDVRYHATDPTNAGATVFSGGDLTIDDTYYYGTNTSLAVTSLAENSFIMVDINTVDDATGLKIWLIGTK